MRADAFAKQTGIGEPARSHQRSSKGFPSQITARFKVNHSHGKQLLLKTINKKMANQQ